MNKINKMITAPIVVFVYNRPDHTRCTLEALQRNELADQSELFIYSDGPKNPSDVKKVSEVRNYLKTVGGFAQINIIEQEQNLGLANSIINGVSHIVGTFGRLIVLEDDLVTSPYFLRYMNDALELYENDDCVISIHGYSYPVTAVLPNTFFLRGADCWGWATWKRGWDLFEPDGRMLLDEMRGKNLTKTFDFNGAYPFTNMLEHQIAGKNDSWAIRWYASAFLKNKLTLYPGKSLVQNIGNDGTGTHFGSTDIYKSNLSKSPVIVKKICLREDMKAKKIIEKYLHKANGNDNFINKSYLFIKKYLKGLCND